MLVIRGRCNDGSKGMDLMLGRGDGSMVGQSSQKLIWREQRISALNSVPKTNLTRTKNLQPNNKI